MSETPITGVENTIATDVTQVETGLQDIAKVVPDAPVVEEEAKSKLRGVFEFFGHEVSTAEAMVQHFLDVGLHFTDTKPEVAADGSVKTVNEGAEAPVAPAV